MQPKRALSTVLLVSILLVAISAAAAWVAVGGIANATERALERMESALSVAKDLADTTASSASELEQVVGVMSDGLATTADAVVATRDVSASVRKILDLVDFIGSVDALQKSLTEAEAQLVFVQGSLITASTTLDQAVPALHETVVALSAIPDEIDAAIADATAARERVGNQVWLWRLAVVTGALAIMGGLWVARANGRRVDALIAAVGTPAEPSAA
jgi:hypothetical protein